MPTYQECDIVNNHILAYSFRQFANDENIVMNDLIEKIQSWLIFEEFEIKLDYLANSERTLIVGAVFDKVVGWTALMVL